METIKNVNVSKEESMEQPKKAIERLTKWINESKAVSRHNRQLIFDFVGLKRQQHENLTTIKSYLLTLYYFAEWAGDRPFEGICKSQKEMVGYFSQLKPRKKTWNGSNEYKATTIFFYQCQLKHFAKWLLKLGRREEPKSMAWIKKPREDGLKKEDILQPEEIQQMIDASDNLRDAAICHSLYESMNRAGEFLQWTVNSVQIEEDFAKVEVKGKGNVLYCSYIVNSLPSVRAWIEAHPFKHKKGHPLWISFSGPCYGKVLTIAGLNRILKKIARRAKIEKRVWPHLLRHSGITSRIKMGFNPELLKQAVGHKRASNMIASTYSHLASEDVEAELKRKYGLNGAEPVAPQLERITCPRCKKVWAPGTRYCDCNFVFDPAEIVKREQSLKEQIVEMIEAALAEKGTI